jgi:hypothetical protein
MADDRKKADANSSASGEDTLMSVGQNSTEFYEETAQAVQKTNKENQKQNNS